MFVFDFVAIFLFLSCRWGPVRFISTYGRNTTPDGLAHLRSFAATTVEENFSLLKNHFALSQFLTFNCHFVFTWARLCEQINLNWHFPDNFVVNVGWIWNYTKIESVKAVLSRETNFKPYRRINYQKPLWETLLNSQNVVMQSISLWCFGNYT